MQRNYRWIVLPLCLAATFFCGCDLVFRAVFGPPGPTLTAFTHPDDPLLLSAVTPDGEALEIFGERDADGMPVALSSLRFQTPQQRGTDAATRLFFDDQARVSKIVGEDGSTIELEWIDDSRVIVEARSADGSIQVNTPVDLSDTSETSAKRTHVDPRTAAGVPSIRQGVPLHLTIEPLALLPGGEPVDSQGLPGPSVAAVSGKQLAAAQASNSGRVVVTVQRCGEPVNKADVIVTTGELFSGFSSGEFPAKPTGTPGEYVATLPTVKVEQTISGATAEKICNAIASVLGAGCKVAKLASGQETRICAAIAAAIDTALAGPTGEGAGIFVACEAGFRALKAYCNTIGKGAVPGAPKPANFICDHIREFVDRAPADPSLLIEIQAFATLPGVKKPAASASPRVSATGPFPDLSIDFGGVGPAAGPWDIDPRDPAPGQGYVATVRVVCVNAGDLVRLSVQGSDGFTDSTVGVIEDGASLLSLSVPGAEEGTHDLITLTVNLQTIAQDIAVF